ncbi:GTP-binding protein [Thermithiobacillus plumbiphilus]|uniref:ATP/GTP-binding protein n=1 Tax=Thermithiobacillus plumbiphilus TaxID=1729899 RepID=A0ABU9D700_9PROT
MSNLAEADVASTKRQRPKIVFTGTVGAGKTTALKAISDIAPVTTDVRASEDEVAAIKDNTTVAMDYGHLVLASGVKVDLYATPGQERFSFMWEILGRNSAGLILLSDASRPNPIEDFRFFWQRFQPIVKSAPVVVGLTKTDCQSPELVEALQDQIRRDIPGAGAMAVDARNAVDMKKLVFSLLLRIDPALLR